MRRGNNLLRGKIVPKIIDMIATTSKIAAIGVTAMPANSKAGAINRTSDSGTSVRSSDIGRGRTRSLHAAECNAKQRLSRRERLEKDFHVGSILDIFGKLSRRE